jgi:hypothetical protein
MTNNDLVLKKKFEIRIERFKKSGIHLTLR